MNPRSVKVGYGFYIGHGGPLIVHPMATIGNNCNVSQFVTIGSVGNTAPSIGNEVWIGPNCVISGEVRIGDRAVVGAGSVVMKNVESDTTVAGVLAKKVSEKNSITLVTNKFISRDGV